MNPGAIRRVVARQRAFFASGATRDLAGRRRQLRVLRRAIQDHEAAILRAVARDMKRPVLEGYVAEVGTVLGEIDHALGHLKGWAKPQKARTPVAHFPASARIYREPRGVVLIIGSWNYPFQLVLAPLVGAIAAGNCAVLKPSEVAASSAQLIARIIAESFDPGFVTVVAGGQESAQSLLAERFDAIFFTGAAAKGRAVLAAAAKHLTPVTLELGGKSPCIVHGDARLDCAARRIAWGKFFNAGQTCVAPDYLLVQRDVGEELLGRLRRCVTQFYGADPSQSPDFGRIVNDGQFARLCRLLRAGRVVFGGQTDAGERYIAPTAIDRVPPESAIMEEEIFGPVLPVIPYDRLADAVALVNRQARPLALYLFSRDRALQRRVLAETCAGGGCINDTLSHVAAPALPFGGVGGSGFGSYHGQAGFDAFSHTRGILERSSLLDIRLRYPPYRGKLRWLRRLL